jgi:hypothetical protein
MKDYFSWRSNGRRQKAEDRIKIIARRDAEEKKKESHRVDD